MDQFILNSKYTPAGDQPKAIDKLVQGIQAGVESKLCLVLPVPVKSLPWQYHSEIKPSNFGFGA